MLVTRIILLAWGVIGRTNPSKKCVAMALAILSLVILAMFYNFLGDESYSLRQLRYRDSSWTKDYDDGELSEDTSGRVGEMIEGPCSLRRRTREDPLVRRRFNFSVPVLQWARSFTLATWEKLKDSPPPYGWKWLSAKDVENTLALLQNSSNGRLFERQSAGQCVRCAVVGNGGILRGSKQGQEIDNHDFVFRVNGAVIKDFEEDVGAKTSFYGFTTNSMKNSLRVYITDGFTMLPQNTGIRYIFIPSAIRDYVMMAAAIEGVTVSSGKDFQDQPARYFGHKPPESFKMLHPGFINYVTQTFLNSPQLTDSRSRDIYMPSTGALMLMTALHTCDQVSAYGFITENHADFSEHYYDAVKRPLRFVANHDLEMEGFLWDVLDSRKVMRLYKRPKRG